MTTAQPAKFSRPSSKARKVLTSMSLVGSSSKSTLAHDLSVKARCKRFLSPPDNIPQRFSWSFPLKLKRLRYARALTSRLPTLTYSVPPEMVSYTVFCGSILECTWSTYPTLTVSPTSKCPLSAVSIPIIIRKSVVFPAPLGPIIPTIPLGGNMKLRFSKSSFSPKALDCYAKHIRQAKEHKRSGDSLSPLPF